MSNDLGNGVSRLGGGASGRVDDVAGTEQAGQAMTENSESEPKRRGSGRPFQKGQSGNPGGVPKELRELIALCRELTVSAVETIAELASNATSETVRLQAASWIVERAYGKAIQPQSLVDMDGNSQPASLQVVFVKPGDGQ